MHRSRPHPHHPNPPPSPFHMAHWSRRPVRHIALLARALHGRLGHHHIDGGSCARTHTPFCAHGAPPWSHPTASCHPSTSSCRRGHIVTYVTSAPLRQPKRLPAPPPTPDAPASSKPQLPSARGESGRRFEHLLLRDTARPSEGKAPSLFGCRSPRRRPSRSLRVRPTTTPRAWWLSRVLPPLSQRARLSDAS